MSYRAPPATFPRADGKVKRISLPEDVYTKKFFEKYPESKHEDAIKYYFAIYAVAFIIHFCVCYGMKPIRYALSE